MTNISSTNLPQPRAGTSLAPGAPALGKAGGTPAPVRGAATEAMAAENGAAYRSARPVRISRHPEEAALFAYNRHAQLHANQARPQIDEYV